MNVVPIRPLLHEPPIVVLPHNIEAEQAVLGSALVSNTVLDRCPWLHPGDFFEPVHGRIWQAMRDAVASGELADPVTLRRMFDADGSLTELEGGRYLVRMAQAADTIINATAYAKHIKKLARLRDLHQLGKDIADYAVAPDAEEAAVIWHERFGGQLAAILRDDGKPTAKTAATVCTEILRGLEEPPRSWCTGIEALDESLGGGVQEGYVIGFEARPKGFKTGCAHSLLLGLAQQNVPSGYFALEMGSVRLAKRMLGHIGGFKSSMFRHVDQHTITRTIQASRAFGALKLWFVDSPGLTFSRLRAITADLTRSGVRVFVLDYWQLVQPDQPTRNKGEFLAEVAQWCADQAHANGTTWIICSQENRSGESYGSDGLAKACDWHAVLHKNPLKFALTPEMMVETLWMEVKFARDSAGDSIGTEQRPKLYINPNGPHLAQLP
jgi:replicative DNA helicase